MSLINHLFFTELLGLRVYDLKGRELGRIRDAALVPLVDAIRVDRFLLGGGPAWLTVRYDQVGRINLDGLWLRDELLTPHHPLNGWHHDGVERSLKVVVRAFGATF